MPQQYVSYVVTPLDTIESIAQRELGDINRAAEIVFLNRLRYPYISSSPRDRYGGLLGTATLVAPVQDGTVLRVDRADPGIFPDGGIAYLEGTGTPYGLPFYDALLIVGTARGVGTSRPRLSPGLKGRATDQFGNPLPPGDSVVFGSPIAHAYAAGTTVYGYPDQRGIPTRVVAPGETILLPARDARASDIQPGPEDLALALGTDIALDDRGQIALGADGDLATIAGAGNVAAALRRRLLSRPGDLPAHPAYGNAAHEWVGRSGPEVLPGVYAALAQALLADPRVARVVDLSAARLDDRLVVGGAASIRDSVSVVSLANLILAPDLR